MKKAFVLLVIMTLPAMIASGAELERFFLYGPMVVAGLNGDAHSELVMTNLYRPRVANLTFRSMPPMSGTIIDPKFSVNGSRPVSSYEVRLEQGTTTLIFRNDKLTELFKGWVIVTVLAEGDGISGELKRVVDGVEYTSDLTQPKNFFEFPIEETASTLTGLAITKDSGAFYALSDVEVSLHLADGTVLDSVNYERVNDLTQDSRLLWQHFTETPEQWRAIVGDGFKGTARVTARGWPVVATTVTCRVGQ